VIEEFAVTKMIAVKSIAKDSLFFQYYTFDWFGLFFHELIC